MKLHSTDGGELMRIDALERDGDELLVRGRVFGTLPMTAKLRPEEARRMLKLLNFRLVLFLLTFLFRRGAQHDAQQ